MRPTTKLLKCIAVIAPLLLLSSCWYSSDDPIEFPEGPVEGYKPIYATEIDLTVTMEGPRPVGITGKIYTKNNYVFLIEPNQGIHIIDNADLRNPNRIGFLSVMGAMDMAIRDNVLYVSQYQDLISVDISDLADLKIIDRAVNVLQNGHGILYPPEFGFFFECPDLKKGILVGWEFTTIISPKCF